MLASLKHRLFKTGPHILGERIVVTKYHQADPHSNIFEVKQFSINYCPVCKVSFGYPDKNEQWKGKRVELDQKYFINMINLKKKFVMTTHYADQKVDVNYH